MNRKEIALARLSDALRADHWEWVNKAEDSARFAGCTLSVGDEPDFKARAEQLIQEEIYVQASNSALARLALKRG